MQYSTICIKPYGDRSYPEYYPQIDEKGHFIPEQGDNSATSTDFTGFKIAQNASTVFESDHGLDGKLFITDARIVLMCDDYESADILWIGNPVVTAIAGIASSAMAKSRSAGKVLTGHVRFEWIEGVVATSEKLLLNMVEETIVITYRDPFDTPCSLTVSLKNKKGMASKVEAEIEKRMTKQKSQHMGRQHRHELPAISSDESSSSAFCGQCGKRIKKSDIYCKYCGARQ